MSGRVAVSFTLDAAMHAAIEKRAHTMNLRATEYVRRLTEAAYAARVGAEKKLPVSDNDLDRAVRAVFCLAGEFKIAEIARATGFPADMVDNVLRGFRIVASDIAAREAEKLPREAESKPTREPRKSSYSPHEIETIRDLWGRGATAVSIAEKIGRTPASLKTWIKSHRDICPRRRARRGDAR